MTNNDIFKKLRVALQLRDDQIIEIMQLVDFRISKGEIGNIFRNPDHPKYVECGDQILRNFLNGLVIHLRGTKEDPKIPMEVIKTHKTSSNVPGNENIKVNKPIARNSNTNTFRTNKKVNPLKNIKFNNGKPKKNNTDSQ